MCGLDRWLVCLWASRVACFSSFARFASLDSPALHTLVVLLALLALLALLVSLHLMNRSLVCWLARSRFSSEAHGTPSNLDVYARVWLGLCGVPEGYILKRSFLEQQGTSCESKEHLRGLMARVGPVDSYTRIYHIT